MPSFVVAAAGQLVTLNKSGSGQASYTVTNTSSQTLRGRLLPRAQPPTRLEWLSVDGESLRRFAPNATEQVIVAVNVPPDAPPGSYAFRLDAISEALPDEDYTEGQSVRFEVPKPQPKKPIPIWIPIAAVIAVVVIGVILFFVLRDGGSSGPTSGSSTCREGFVWRRASPTDRVCVTPATRDQVAADNARAEERREPGGGPYGPDTCKQGFVWREAFPGDHVCVTGATRSQAATDNSLADVRQR